MTRGISDLALPIGSFFPAKSIVKCTYTNEVFFREYEALAICEGNVLRSKQLGLPHNSRPNDCYLLRDRKTSEKTTITKRGYHCPFYHPFLLSMKSSSSLQKYQASSVATRAHHHHYTLVLVRLCIKQSLNICFI
jgi:hypothetical protein